MISVGRSLCIEGTVLGTYALDCVVARERKLSPNSPSKDCGYRVWVRPHPGLRPVATANLYYIPTAYDIIGTLNNLC